MNFDSCLWWVLAFIPPITPFPLPGSAPVFKDAIGPYGNLDTSENFLKGVQVQTA